MSQSAIIEMNLHFRGGNFGVQSFSGLSKTNVLGDQPLLPAQAKARELQIDSAGANSGTINTPGAARIPAEASNAAKVTATTTQP